MWNLLVSSATQTCIPEEKLKNTKKKKRIRGKLPSCVFHVRHKGVENRKGESCWMGIKGNLYFTNLSVVIKGPTITSHSASCSNSHSVPPFTPSPQGFDLLYGNPVSDPRVHSHQPDQPCYELQVCFMQQTTQPFLSFQAHTLSYNMLFQQDRWEQGRSLSNTCCSFASPVSRLLCPFTSFSTGQHLDAGLKTFFQ